MPAVLEVRVLGPLEVLEDGRPLVLGGPHPRAVLAILALHANTVVSRDRLIDEIWGDSPPETAQTALQVYVSRLRKVLGAERIETRPPGYCLKADAEEIDAVRFGALVADARRGPPTGAAETLRHALALWRGPPLADLDEFVARPERARLEEERMAALELRIAADLDLGRHESLVPELEGIVREHPLRERLRGQLMVALYRCGRQAEALEVYREGRRSLDEELGLQPGEELRRLERAILEQDPELASPAAAGVVLHAEERRTRVLRGSRVVAVLGALVLAGAIAALVVALTRSTGASVVVPPNSVAVIDPRTGRVFADIPVGARPIAIAVGEGGVWVANADDGTVSRIDPETRKVVKTIGVGSPASDIAAGEGSVWVANGSEGTLTRIDPRTNTVFDPIDLSGPDELAPAGAYSVAAAYGAVWVGSGQRKLFRIDPTTSKVVGSVAVGSTPADVAAGEGSIWVAHLAGRVLRIEPKTNAVTGRVAAAALPLSIAAGVGSVWVGESDDEGTGAVWRVDPATVTVSGTTLVPGIPVGIAAGEGAVWVAGGIAGTLTRIDARSGRVVDTIHLGNAPLDPVAGDGAVWVAVGSAEDF